MSFSCNATDLQSKTLAFIDANLEAYQYLASGVLDQVEVRILDPEQNGIAQVTTELQKFAAISGAIDAVHIFSHGSPGEVQLGSITLNSQTLEQYKSWLQQWKSCLGDAADLLIYGCRVAAGDGVAFVQRLSELTGANVAASVDLTGNSAKGGNWNLAVKTGEITANDALKPEVMSSYEGVLAILTVTSGTDDNNPGSLRKIVEAANSGDTIAFDSSLANQTITLTQGEIRINPGKNITIDGANAANLTVSGNNASRVFLVDANVDINTNATIKNLKIANGYVNANAGAAPTNNTTTGRGGAIAGADQATLTVENVEFNNNVADKGGGAIYMAWNSNLSVNNSKFNANKAIAGNDERGAGAIAFLSPGTFTVRNSDFTDNRGIVGGAINSLNGKLTIENSRFINNDTESAFFDTGKPNDFLRGYGGAIYTDRASSSVEESQGIGGTIRITGTVFDNNRAKAGGGATHLFTSPTDNIIIENSTYTNNKVSTLVGGEIGDGGGLYQISDAPNRGMIIRNTTFADNTAVNQGGGLRMTNAPTEITNSTFSGNKVIGTSTSVVGGGMVVYGAPVTVTNSTFADNEAGWVGGGITTSPTSTVTLKNTIFRNNTAKNPFNILQHAAGNFVGDGSNNIQYPPKLTTFDPNDKNVLPDIVLADPKLGPLQEINGSFVRPLLPGSPAIDTGTGAGAPNTDQRGVTRPIDGDGNGSAVVDIGSYEFSGDVGTLAPEIEVLDNTTNIVDGTTTPINFGATTIGTPVTKTFSINNTGTDVLSLSTPTLPTGFTLLGNFPTTVAASGSANFQLQLDAAAAGNPTGSISFANNDSDENPFDFAIAGTVTPVTTPTPEIGVLDGTTDIVDGTTKPIDFGSTTIGTPVTKTFSINNTGTDILSLTAPTLPTGFTLVGNFPTTVAASGSANFQLQLDAAAAGNPTGSISFANNDSDENPFDFAIAGTVTPVTTPTPEIGVLDGTTDIVDGTTKPIDFGSTTIGTPVTKTFSINNTGTDVLSLSTPTLPTGFTLLGNFPTTVAAGSTTNFQLQLDAAAAGNPTGSISFANNDSDENPFDFAIAGTVTPVTTPTPEIGVLDGTTDIVDGTTKPIDFGSTTIGTPVTKTFSINNTGTDILSLTAPTLPTGFTLVGNFPTTVAASGSANFQLQLDAAAAGNPTGSISFANNDSDENPFDFAIAGTVTPVTTPTPEIGVLDGTTDIVDGTTKPIDFGSTTIGTPVTKTFSINNTGTDILSLTAPTLPTGFTLVGNFPTTVAASGSANFQLQLDAAAAGNPTGSISFANNDSDENPFDFAIAGTVTPVTTPTPEIGVLDGTTDIVDGTTKPIDFGSTTIGTPVTKTFSINNTGTDVLSLSTPTLPTGFTLLGNFPTNVAAAGTANFQLQLDAAAAGNPTGTISFANNDSNENPFDFAIAGIVNPVPNLKPTITNVTSTAADGKYTVGQFIPINVTFSENVFVNGTPQLVLETGALDAVVNFSSGSGTNTLTFNYKVGVTDTSADLDYLSRTALNLNNGIIEDADGNDAVLTLPTPGTAGSLGANKAIEIPAFNIIAGTNRRDVLTGTDGRDRFIGERSNDILTGGGGADEFVYNRIQDGFDTIKDFQVGLDKIVMTNLFASFNYKGSNPIADGLIGFSSRGNNTVLLLDPDGADGSALARSYIAFRNVSVAEMNNLNNFVFS